MEIQIFLREGENIDEQIMLEKNIQSEAVQKLKETIAYVIASKEPIAVPIVIEK